MTINDKKQRGAVSLFVVIFAALLITVVTVSFVRIMLQNQQQASTTDLSQSAYDSAQAGVEDAKRALIRYQSICNSGGDCATAQTQINSSVCNEAISKLKDVTVSGNEVQVQTVSSNALAQAYTCVKINLNTFDYLGTLSANESNLVPLTSVSQFNIVQVQWFSSKDISSDKGFKVDRQLDANTPLLAQTSWASNRPSLLRAQLIQFSSNGFVLDDFDSKGSASGSDANTLFLYPSSVGADAVSFANDAPRRTPTGKPFSIKCSGDLSAGGYACTAKLLLPAPISGGDRTAFLRVSAFYNKTNYRVTLLYNITPIEFNAVQPEIDSTGRANDLFRRVQTRVELIDVNFPYPEAAVDIAGNLCKDFAVTDNVDDYAKVNSITNGGNTINGCTP